MVRIRLSRVGSKKQPIYRIVVIDREKSRDGKSIEVIGFYNPRTRPDTISLKEERALYWLSVGAQPSDTVVRLFTKTGTSERFTRLRQGETLEALAAEAQPYVESVANIDPRTNYPAPIKKADKSA